MTDPSVVDHLTRLKLKLLETRLENEREDLEKMESPLPAARNRRENMLQSALRQRNDLLHELREQHFLEELLQPLAPAGGHCHNHIAVSPDVYRIPFPAPQVESPVIIQEMMPPQPATIIQQLPHPCPRITQIPPAQPFAAPNSGSIKEDMVEMMLMQNAQMHQIIMQNMMLKALPLVSLTQPAVASPPLLQHAQQDLQFAAPLAVKAGRPRPSAVHHHYHIPPAGMFPVHHEDLPSTSTRHQWTVSMLPALPMCELITPGTSIGTSLLMQMPVAEGALRKDLSQETAMALLSMSGGESKKAGLEAAVLEYSYMLRPVGHILTVHVTLRVDHSFVVFEQFLNNIFNQQSNVCITAYFWYKK